MTLSIALNVGLMASVKHLPALPWVLPLALSFYGFQSLTYTIDIYRRDAKPAQSYLAYLASASFFPTTVAGPITRLSTLLPQWSKREMLTPQDGGKALFLIGIGLVKKLLIADFLAETLVNRVFDLPKLYSGAEVLAGLKPSVTPEIFKRAIEEGSAENCLQHIPVRAGEAIFVPPGTAHTIGAGLVLCEIQECSDLTYRVFDYNRRDAQGRSRELHIEKALRVIRFGEQRGGKIEPARIVRGGVTETYFVACHYFAAEKWEFAERTAAATSPEHFDVLIFLEGCGAIQWGGESVEYRPAQTWLLPAALGAYHLAPDERTSLLRAYVPVPLDEFTRKLAAQGVSEAALSRLVYP